MEAETTCGLLRTEGILAITARRTWEQAPARASAKVARARSSFRAKDLERAGEPRRRGRRADQRQEARLADDAVLEMRHAACLAEPVCSSWIRCGNWSNSRRPSEQDADHVDPDLVHEARGEELLVDFAPINPIRCRRRPPGPSRERFRSRR